MNTIIFSVCPNDYINLLINLLLKKCRFERKSLASVGVFVIEHELSMTLIMIMMIMKTRTDKWYRPGLTNGTGQD